MELDNIGKIFMIGDTHFGVRNNSIVWKDDMIDFFDKFVSNLPMHGFNPETDILMLTGDVFHSREFLNVMVFHGVTEMFSRLAAIFKRGIYTILGNHDLFYRRNNNVYAVKALANMFGNFHVFPSPEKLVINGTHKFLMLPFHDDVPVLDDAIREATDCDYLFCHMDIQSFKYNKSIRVDNGVLLETIRRFKRVYAGHLHHRQESGNVLYLGSPYQMDFGDVDTPRGYYVVSVIDDMLSEEYFENAWSPRFKTVTFDELMNMTFEDASKSLNRNYVNVSIPVSAARNMSFNTFNDVMSENKIQPRKLEFKQYDDSYETEQTEMVVTADFNMNTVAKTILEDRKYSHAEIESVLTYFNGLYIAAKSNDKEDTNGI